MPATRALTPTAASQTRDGRDPAMPPAVAGGRTLSCHLSRNPAEVGQLHDQCGGKAARLRPWSLPSSKCRPSCQAASAARRISTGKALAAKAEDELRGNITVCLCWIDNRVPGTQ